eukprot:SAG31_NODE_12287_length_952_cov_1.281360_1_plen_76_part_00
MFMWMKGHHAGQNYSDNIRQAVLTRLSHTADAQPAELLFQTEDIWFGWSTRVREAAEKMEVATVFQEGVTEIPRL